ncbi:hypothetical protein [Parenemella sanctibonifatiensis]|uniref:hypothetical protein n=1 Tax=Parenemella sanctibonifatiensis TaxID=2016505 RepID=UPI001185642D|nr:hypothetical protein [Parenemella sanctibonifatiensis]
MVAGTGRVAAAQPQLAVVAQAICPIPPAQPRDAVVAQTRRPARHAYAGRQPAGADRLDAGNGTYPDFDEAGIAVFAQAVDDVAIPEPTAQAIKDYWAWATRDVLNRYAGSADDVPDDLAVHRWS